MTIDSNMSHPSSKTRMSALEKLKQSNAAKLELETRKMEERIRSLKEKMTKEKEERERLGGTRWTSGRTGPLTTPIQKPFYLNKTGFNGRVTKAPRRIKVLSEEPLNNYVRKPKAKDVSRGNNINYCGQCEEKSSAWVCCECSENYCDTCFNQFHQKGALRKHTKMRVEKVTVKETEIQRSPPKYAKTSNDPPLRSFVQAPDTPSDAGNHKNGNSLLNGSYNEEESAASFAQALQEWRNQGLVSKGSPRNPPICADSSCGTSNDRVNEAVKKKEVQITFHSSLSYGDRLFLKKGREDCSKSLERESQMRIGNKGEKRDRLNEHDFTDKNMGKEDKPHHKSVDYFPPDYREMIQSIAQTKSDQNGKTCSQDLLSQHTVSIRELSPLECNSNEDKGTTCLVEECDEESRETQIRPVSRHGRLSIQEMSTTENFSEPTETELNSCVNSSSSPKLVSSINSKPFLITPTRQAKEKKLSTRNNSAGRIHSKKFLANKDEEYKTPGIPAYQEWKPKPCYKELTDFFLAGVEKDNERKKFAGNGSNFTSSSSITGDLSRNCLSTTWQPQRSLPLTTTNTTDIPLPVQMKGRNFPTSSQSTDLKEKDSGGPKEDNFHRVTKSRGESGSLQLYPNNSKDSIQTSVTSAENVKQDSDDEEELERSSTTVVDDFGTGNQDDDDLATLDDLAWELASSTGRLTHCEQDIIDMDRSDDVDVIEDKESGSGLSGPNTLERSQTVHESLMDDFEEMERKFMEEEF